jgi:hypothetical protein
LYSLEDKCTCRRLTAKLLPVLDSMVTLFYALLLAIPCPALGGGPQSQIPIKTLDHSQNYQFDPLLHLPGISPYFDAVGFGLRHSAPLDCNVTAASYLIRHAAIYANDADYDTYIKPFLWKLEKHRGRWSGPLEFLNHWHSPIDEDRLEEITPSGAVDAVNVGKHLLARYPDLVPTTKKILADKKPRTYDTAKAFVRAFPHAESIEVVKVLKEVNGPSLIPHKSCPAFSKEPGSSQMTTFVNHYAPGISNRLAAFTPFKLSNNDIVGLQQLCGYASGIDGRRSSICAIFTDAEWMAYEYAWDLRYAHMVGPLNPLSPYLGFPWLQKTTTLFDRFTSGKPGIVAFPDNDDMPDYDDNQRFFLAFTHREVPPFIATALGIFNSSSNAKEEFPTDQINWVRAWKMSDLIPFLGHVGLERMTCRRSDVEEDFVRVIANSAPRPIPMCQDGPGASCPFVKFKDLIVEGMQKYGDFDGVCSVDSR